MPETKKNRCWPGYEPVKGKPQHSQGSCRPKAKSKLSDPEKKFRTKRKKQLDNWKKKHPGSRKSAAQHLSSPTARKKSSSTARKSSTRKTTAKHK